MHTNLSAGDRVTHANPVHRYGAGELLEVIPSRIRPPSKARVLFDGERAPRLVWLDDLAPAAEPRLVYPVERAGLRVVAPAVA